MTNVPKISNVVFHVVFWNENLINWKHVVTMVFVSMHDSFGYLIITNEELKFGL